VIHVVSPLNAAASTVSPTFSESGLGDDAPANTPSMFQLITHYTNQHTLGKEVQPVNI
jgi:hypothetical protein